LETTSVEGGRALGKKDQKIPRKIMKYSRVAEQGINWN